MSIETYIFNIYYHMDISIMLLLVLGLLAIIGEHLLVKVYYHQQEINQDRFQQLLSQTMHIYMTQM